MMRGLALLGLMWFAGLSGAAELTAGAAAVDITPPIGTPMAGYYNLRGAEGTHDPLFAKALVIEKDGVKVALVTLDLIATTFPMVAESRKLIAEQVKIPGTHVMISATHSHTGPVLSDRKPRASAFGGDHKLAVAFMDGLPGKIAEAVAEADKSRKAARILRAIGKEEGLAFNRRFHMTDGTVGWNPGKKNPKIIKPAGPTDDRVPVTLIETADGKETIACYVNFAMHLDTVGGLYYSADYPYTLSKAIAAAKGENVVTLFAIGCAGDINHINVSSATKQGGHGEAARIGTRLAAAVLRAFDHLEPVEDAPLQATAMKVSLPLAPVTQAEAAEARDIIEKVTAGAQPVPKFMDQVQAFKAADVAERLGKPLEVEVQVITLGRDLAWVSLPGEIFVELGLAIHRGSPFKQTMIAELANGSIGYVPNRPAYAQGNYEVVSARCAVGSGEMLVDSALQQLRSLFLSSAPKTP